ncbi:MAG: pteridine reductase [Moraxellaceae bacterium]|nr:pteridine reductase [Moraxellaceae bacterium]
MTVASCSEKNVVLVTGAALRLGAATVREMHARGWHTLIHCRQSRESADMLAAELNRTTADSCRVLQADLASDADIHKLASDALAAWGRVDALINNASSFYPTAIGNVTATDWDDLFSSNARAPFFLAQALAPELKKRQGAIVSLIDIHAEKPLKEHTVYCMAKAAHAMMVLSLAKELAPEVRVNGVAPGAILWPSTGTVPPELQAHTLAGIPLRRLGSADDIARTIAFLLEDAPYITGQIIAVDGGRRL